MLQAFLQGLVAGSAFENGPGLGSRLAVGAQEGDAMAGASGVNADAETVPRTDGGPNGSPGNEEWTGWVAGKVKDKRCERARESPPGTLRPGEPRDERSGPQEVPKPCAKAGGDNLF